MLTVKLMKYGKPTYSGGVAGPGQPPIPTERLDMPQDIVIYPASRVYIECRDAHGRTVIGIADPKDHSIEHVTVGQPERDDVMFHIAFVMNDQGRTVETVR
jgi:hypothetical protein